MIFCIPTNNVSKIYVDFNWIFWFTDSYTEAKNRLTLFCETSTTEVEISNIKQSQRKRIPKRHFDLSDAEHYINSPSKQHKKKTKQQSFKKGNNIMKLLIL